MVRVFCHDDKDLPELVSMWVAPSFRGSDAAGELLRQVLDWAKSEGHSGIYLRVMTANARAIRFYERLGFSPNGITDELPDGRAELEFEHRFR